MADVVFGQVADAYSGPDMLGIAGMIFVCYFFALKLPPAHRAIHLERCMFEASDAAVPTSI